VRIVAISAGAAAIALTAVAAAAPAPNATLLAIMTGDSPALVRVDAATLTQLPGPTAALPAKAGGGFPSPDRSIYVFGTNGEPSLTFFDVRRMEFTGTLETGRAGSADPLAWPEQRRLLVEAWGCCPTRAELVVVDPVKRTVVARVPLVGGGLVTTSTANGVAALLDPEKGIGPVRLVAIGRDGDAHAVVVSRIKAGTKWRGKGSDRRASIRQPGFAVDREGQVAFIVDPGGLVGQIDLTTLQLSYHPTATRRLARASKQIDGPMLSARWVGDGRIAVSGTKAKLRKTASGWRQTWTPAGVALLDTHTWSSHMLDAGARSFTASGDALFVAGNGVLTAYALDGTVRYRTAIPAGDGYVSVFGDYAYAWTAAKVAILDIRSGTVLATLPSPQLYLIGPDS
jgi:hypothetical protein